METTKDPYPQSSLAMEAKAEGCDRVSQMSEHLMGEIYDKICFYLEQKQVFLDQHLTLSKLSALVGTNNAYLSNTVNLKFGCNLPTLVNRYRIEKAKQLMEQGNHKVKDIYNMCGFLSRSAFYTAFTKEIGMTPTRFQRLSITNNNTYRN